ncbi:MAG: sugar ABC transporter substrate-binding protein [Vannielia sp.]|uniref:sugar ABC transporter substrate-binding protein n=1 Tax=Rhodobacterales TaxID=204455 RepID=UPI00209463DD|nr:sugar ABC transporter substrate-binding protein [Oceanicola sp. 502str15]MCO6384143.1 substrate-binding domain-containing protein [Oceanicola sp. 502str15]
MKTLFKAVAIAAVSTLGLGAGTVAKAEGEKLVYIYHSGDEDFWWNTIKNTLDQAESELGITVDVRNPPNGDSAQMARIVEQAAAADYDGMIVTIGDYDALRDAITGAVDSGMPVITVNSGTQEQSESMGALMHIGQPEFDAGKLGGERAKADGVSDFVCFNHQMGNIPLTDRCAGFAEGLGLPELGDRMVDLGGDPVEAKNRAFAYLKANPDVEAILTLGPNGGDPTLQALEELGLAGAIYWASFELSDDMIGALKDGSLKWSIDQQQFFQGYLAANLLTNYIRYGVRVPHHINSGPGFLTKDNIEQVESLIGTFR